MLGILHYFIQPVIIVNNDITVCCSYRALRRTTAEECQLSELVGHSTAAVLSTISCYEHKYKNKIIK